MFYKYLRLLRILIAVIIGMLSFAAFFDYFYPLKIFNIQLVPLTGRLLKDFSIAAAVLFILLIAAAFAFGRIYCSTVCPFGISQELLTTIFRRRQKIKKNHRFKYFWAALCFGFLAGGTTLIIRLTDPYSLFGSAAGGGLLGLTAVGFVMILVWYKGRLFCSDICPVGTVLGLIAKHACYKIRLNPQQCIACGLCVQKCPTGSIDIKNKQVNNETCIKCFNCLSSCPKKALTFNGSAVSLITPLYPSSEAASIVPLVSDSQNFDPSRRQFLTAAAAGVVAAAAYKAGFWSRIIMPAAAKDNILPPGGGNQLRFATSCLNCNLCVTNCPMKIIKTPLNPFKPVYIDYENSFCDYNCHKCSTICPSGAIKPLTLEQKRNTKIAAAIINTNVCVQCGLCVYECPRGAISKADRSFPVIDTSDCIGCGACHAICPVKAISMTAIKQQKEI